MKKTITLFSPSRFTFMLLFLFVLSGVAEAVGYYFYVQLSDKNGTPYSLSNPSEYLSARAIARRTAFGLSCDSTDLPVNPSYVTAIQATGVSVFRTSKWMNGVTVLVEDSSLMSAVRVLPFVTFVQYTGKTNTVPPLVGRQKFPKETTLDYGSAATQINQVNGAYLHDLGYTGTGIHVGVLDAGFTNVNSNPGFASLRSESRLLGTKNIAGGGDVYSLHSHGANVLSIMTGNLPTQYLGTAPDASFWLIRTEVDLGEYLVEVDFWVSGIEFADSVGVDVVNSSLGYTEFTDPTMNFTYADMNGLVSRASIAATMAAEKGIIVCNSAGNSGGSTWNYIGSPADADRILSIGAVDGAGNVAGFSSFGPSSDGRVKPELSAVGWGTSIIGTSGSVTSGSGTSYSSPLMAGMMACYLQYVKANRSRYYLDDILHSVVRSGSLYGSSPDPQIGYGIPNFQVAVANLPTYDAAYEVKSENAYLFLDNKNHVLRVSILNEEFLNGQIRVYNIAGQLCLTKTIESTEFKFDTNTMHSGVYIVSLQNNGNIESQKIIVR